MLYYEEMDQEKRLAKEAKVKVQYIGHKPVKYDIVGNTNIAWHGHGDVQEVPASVAERLFKHSTVWAKPGTVKAAPKAPQPAPEPAREPTIDEKIRAFSDKNALEAFVMDEFGEDIDKRKRLDVLKNEAIALARAAENAADKDGDLGDDTDGLLD